jgi:mono/diheme cytochrome c family protein
MISEERLREMLDAAADSYPAPPEGVERILTLAAGPVQAPRRKPDSYERDRRRRRRWTIAWSGVAASVVAVLIAAAVLTGGGGRSSSNSASSGVAASSAAGSPEKSSASADAAAPQAPFRANCANCHSSIPQSGASTNQAAPAQPSVQPRIIETGDASLEVRTGQVPAALTKLQSLATSLGGLVAASQSESGPTPSGAVTLRVPQAKVGELMSRLPSVGSVVSSSTNTKDVTGQYVDLTARLKALTATRDTYLTMLSKATTIGDTLSVQQQIDGIQQQIEQLQGEQKLLASQSDLATLDVNVSEKGAAATVPTEHHRNGFNAAVHRAWDRFTGGLESVVAASGTLALVLIGCAVAYVGGRVLYRSVRRRMV